MVEGGNTLEDTLEYLQYFEKEVDVFDVSCGLNGSIQYQIDANYLPDGWRSYMAKAVKEKYGKPCMTVGNIRDPKVAEDILAKGDADFIGMGRGLIADPEWVNKVEFGKECDIRKCISCNIGCAGHRIGLNQPIRCTVNPAVNSGEDYMKHKINKPCNVVVIGGGTAGLEAACTAAEVGCTTFLIEKKAELGGLASVISKIPDKKRLADFPNYMIHRASKLHNLFIFKNTSATPELVKSLNPDIIVNATGSVPTLPPITGLHDLVDKDDSNVATVLKMIDRINKYPEKMDGQKVAIIGGGGPSGLTSAYFLQLMGHQCTVFEEKKQLGGMLRYGIPNYRFPRERLQEDIDAILSTGVDVKLNTTIGTEELKQIQQEYDAIYVAIGAHTDKKLGLEGEDSKNVISAVDMLREIGDGAYPDSPENVSLS